MCKNLKARFDALEKQRKIEIGVGAAYAFLLLLLAMVLVGNIGLTGEEVEELEVDGHS